MTNSHNASIFLGLDVGQRRIGVARVNMLSRIPQPIGIVEANEQAINQIAKIADQEIADVIVVGIPRNLSGEETDQSQQIRQFASDLQSSQNRPVEFADETLSSVRAKEYQKDHPKDHNPLDAIAACFILEEFMSQRAKAELDK